MESGILQNIKVHPSCTTGELLSRCIHGCTTEVVSSSPHNFADLYTGEANNGKLDSYGTTVGCCSLEGFPFQHRGVLPKNGETHKGVVCATCPLAGNNR